MWSGRRRSVTASYSNSSALPSRSTSPRWRPAPPVASAASRGSRGGLCERPYFLLVAFISSSCRFTNSCVRALRLVLHQGRGEAARKSLSTEDPIFFGPPLSGRTTCAREISPSTLSQSFVFCLKKGRAPKRSRLGKNPAFARFDVPNTMGRRVVDAQTPPLRSGRARSNERERERERKSARV